MKYVLKTKNTCLKTAERITRLKKFHLEALNLTFKIHITINNYSLLYGYVSKGLETNKFKNLIG